MLIQIVAILHLAPFISAHPVFGTKRYGRSHHPSWGMTYQPVHYYNPEPAPVAYAYPQDYSDDYYYPSYPYYAKYYQMPYYYADAHQRPGYGYHYYDEGADPVDSLQEEIQQEEQREEREDALPVGQETWYQNSNDNMADVNALFMQNLILSQMYNNGNLYPYHTQYAQPEYVQPHYGYGYGYAYPENADDGWVYGDVRANAAKYPYYYYGDDDYAYGSNEEEDARELKSLAMVKKSQQPEVPAWMPVLGGQQFLTERKMQVTTEATTTTAAAAGATTTPGPRGQKEEPLLRPATPARRPRHPPSVYDTIKQLLQMERGLTKKDDTHQRFPRKRFVSSEDSLVEELSGLKKLAV